MIDLSFIIEVLAALFFMWAGKFDERYDNHKMFGPKWFLVVVMMFIGFTLFYVSKNG